MNENESLKNVIVPFGKDHLAIMLRMATWAADCATVWAWLVVRRRLEFQRCIERPGTVFLGNIDRMLQMPGEDVIGHLP